LADAAPAAFSPVAIPQVDVSLVTSERNLGTLRSGYRRSGAVRRRPLQAWRERICCFNEEVFPVCSPQLAQGPRAPAARALCGLPAAAPAPGKRSRWFDWNGLFRELGITGTPTPGHVALRQLHLLIQAAIAGQGVAIGWRHLVDNLLEQNWLCRPISSTVISRLGYYVVQPQRKRRGQLVDRFVEWLVAEQANSAHSLTGLALPSIAV
jgi:DNA-binding transcriptional LysR family regulator